MLDKFMFPETKLIQAGHYTHVGVTLASAKTRL